MHPPTTAAPTSSASSLPNPSASAAAATTTGLDRAHAWSREAAAAAGGGDGGGSGSSSPAGKAKRRFAQVRTPISAFGDQPGSEPLIGLKQSAAAGLLHHLPRLASHPYAGSFRLGPFRTRAVKGERPDPRRFAIQRRPVWARRCCTRMTNRRRRTVAARCIRRHLWAARSAGHRTAAPVPASWAARPLTHSSAFARAPLHPPATPVRGSSPPGELRGLRSREESVCE